MSYTRQLLYGIADQMGRNRRDMDQYIAVLEKNWYDSKESLQSITPNDFDRFGIPSRLSAIIMEKVGSAQKHSMGSSSMDAEFSVAGAVSKMKSKLNPQKFNYCIGTLTKLFRNIRQNLTQEKFRTLKKSNKVIGEVASVGECYEILIYGGFQNSKELLVMKQVNLGRIDECLDVLVKNNEETKFNPFQAEFLTTTGQKQLEGESSVIFNEKLEELEQYRKKVMSKPIKDRKVRVFKEQNKGESKPDSTWNEERALNNDQQIYAEAMKEKLKSYGQNPKFMNRRKQEYFELMKKPCFEETLIRVKLPDRYIFECVFSPSETLGELVKIFHDLLDNKNLPYYLYMTPPVEKLTGMMLRQTFYEKDCVPSGLFYFGCDVQIPGDKILRVKPQKTGFFS